ncbi:hypothetical protein [Nonomuraea zeae]|uniref:Uncharacterized protein n=1 Tax=Nonomuraea zeae TaxID=1642303 RepID=A0A5S4GHN4_9ACTN|nr:hypothetical protein [Nonomuraea zeae]TMR25760.1 hypothetical protein ETD85_44780 [Nonomuraea zeae]
MNDPPPRRPAPRDDVDHALADVMKAIGAAARTLALQSAASMAGHGDLGRLAACLDAMPPDRLAEVAAAARLLSTEAEQALARRP